MVDFLNWETVLSKYWKKRQKIQHLTTPRYLLGPNVSFNQDGKFLDVLTVNIRDTQQENVLANLVVPYFLVVMPKINVPSLRRGMLEEIQALGLGIQFVSTGVDHWSHFYKRQGCEVLKKIHTDPANEVILRVLSKQFLYQYHKPILPRQIWLIANLISEPAVKTW